MKAFPTKAIRLALCCYVLFVAFSCSKDTDLLADYVIAENLDSYFLTNLVVDDSFITNGNNSVVLDVLNNDNFINPDKVKIIKTSEPTSGTVTINEDKTLTYQPKDAVTDTESESDATDESLGQEDTPQSSDSTETQNDQETDTTEESESTDSAQETATEQTEATEPQQKQEASTTEETSEESSKPEEDTFTYTVETTKDDGSTETKEGTVIVVLDYGDLKAFPGAIGYGKNTTGGRGGRVIDVKNLNDSGTGSLRAAIEASGPRTVVFGVSGYINLSKPLIITNNDITIAGQTAPGNGITIKNEGIEVRASNVILRYIRVRPGSASSAERDAIRVIESSENKTMKNIIIDHCSISWGKDEVLSFTANRENSKLRDITVQNCIISEGTAAQYGVLVMGDVKKTSFVQNYLAHNKDRQFRASTAITEFEVINNIMYNFRWGTQVSFGGKFDIINNIYKISENISPQSGNAMTYIKSGNTPDAKAEDGEVHQSGNVVINSNFPDTNLAFRNHNQSQRIFSSSLIEPMMTGNLDNKILADVGASLFDDPVDQRVISDYKHSTGYTIKSEQEVGGYPNLNVVHRENSYDQDQDGMEDYWELQNGLDPNDQTDGKADRNNDGFTNLEDFLHSLTLSNGNNNS